MRIFISVSSRDSNAKGQIVSCQCFKLISICKHSKQCQMQFRKQMKQLFIIHCFELHMQDREAGNDQKKKDQACTSHKTFP